MQLQWNWEKGYNGGDDDDEDINIYWVPVVWQVHF